jgi:hypothetical protein
MLCRIRSLWWIQEQAVREHAVKSKLAKENKVRLRAESDEKTVLVQIKIKQRDSREKVDELNEATGKPTGRKVDNPRYGKFYYESFDTIEVEQATGTEVKEAVLRGIAAAAKK